MYTSKMGYAPMTPAPYTPPKTQPGMRPSQPGIQPRQPGGQPALQPLPQPSTPPLLDQTGMMDPNNNNVFMNPLYTQGYLAQNIGRYIKAEFLIGTNGFVDKEGVLTEVGISYIVIQEPRTDDFVLCDIYSIKFVTFFY